MSVPEPGSWLVCAQPRPQATRRLFCFPYAGGGAGVFRRWAAALPATIEVRAVQLPGRESRLREPPLRRMGDLVEAVGSALRPCLDRPFAFFGHSMGALVAFEVARWLRQRGLPALLHLFVSARRAPHLPGGRRLHALSDTELVEQLVRLGGTPREVLEHPAMMQLLLPMLRADFETIETHEHRPEAPLDCPITALGGTEDPETTEGQLEAWKEHVTGPFKVHMLPGNHFYLQSAEARLLGLIERELAACPDDRMAAPLWEHVARRPPLGDGEVHVWRSSLELPSEVLATLEATLNSEERERADRFHFARDRRQYVVGRGLLRLLLGGYLGARAASLRFTYGLHGKPSLAGEHALRFNLSHSHGMALFAFCRGRELGVDVEWVRADFASDAIARRFFSANEVAALCALPAQSRKEAFFSCWSRKEAYLKATGRGLTLALDSFDVSLAPRPAALLATRHDPTDAARWTMFDLAPGPGYAGALAVEGPGPRLWCGDWSVSCELTEPPS